MSSQNYHKKVDAGIKLFKMAIDWSCKNDEELIRAENERVFSLHGDFLEAYKHSAIFNFLMSRPTTEGLDELVNDYYNIGVEDDN